MSEKCKGKSPDLAERDRKSEGNGQDAKDVDRR